MCICVEVCQNRRVEMRVDGRGERETNTLSTFAPNSLSFSSETVLLFHGKEAIQTTGCVFKKPRLCALAFFFSSPLPFFLRSILNNGKQAWSKHNSSFFFRSCPLFRRRLFGFDTLVFFSFHSFFSPCRNSKDTRK